MKKLTYSLLCLLFISCESPLSEKHWQIGQFKIYQSDADARLKIVQIFYPQNKIADAGLLQLKNAYLLANVLENNGHLINDHKLTNESSRIDSSSRDPKTLKKIKDIFQKNGSMDKEAYFKVFILPSYVERNLPSVFQELPLHVETLKRAQDFYASVVANPETLSSTAEKEKLDFAKLCLSSAEGFSFSQKEDEKIDRAKGNSLIDMSKVSNEKVRDKILSSMTNTNEALISKWFTEIVAPTKSGTLVSKIVDYYSSWLVLRLVSKSKDKACFEAVMFPKETFESWLENEKAKVSPN